jgi:hypothetical protein
MATKKNQEEAQEYVLELEAKIKGLEKEVSELKKAKVSVGGKNTKYAFDEANLERIVVKFFRNERIFAGFRNTPARILITLASIAVLFGYGYYAFQNPSIALWYVVLILVVLLANAISVRFVFQMEGDTPRQVLDEFHLKRRNKAKERAHDSLKSFIGLVMTGALIYGYKDYLFGDKKSVTEGIPDAVFQFNLSIGQLLVVLFFVSGYVSLVKYFSYGLRGEPFISNEEDKKLRDS